MKELMVFFLSLFTASITYSATIYVPSDSSTIQAGIHGAVNGDTVLVADGTYAGNGNRDLDFGGKRIVLLSENGPETAIIDCEASPADQHRAFHFHSNEDSLARVQGFTIVKGYWNDGSIWDGGGVVQCSSAAPTIVSCLLINNGSNAVYCIDNVSPEFGSGLKLESCTISGNAGNGVMIADGSADIRSCEIRDNESSGVIVLWQGYLLMTESVIYHNGGCGLHVVVIAPSHFELNNCTFVGNDCGVNFYYEPPKFGKRDHVYSLTNCLAAFNDSTGIEASGLLDFNQVACCNSFGNAGGDWKSYLFGPGDDYGNLSLDPLLCDTVNDNFHIMPNSPCAPPHNDCGVLIGALSAGCEYICGDANSDVSVNVGDAVFIINYVFKNGPPPEPVCEGDANGDGSPNVGDAVYLINYVFKKGPPPVEDCCP